MICNTVGISRREQEYLDMLERNIVDGIITASHGFEVEEYLKQTKPIVSIDRDLGSRIPLIGCDHAKGGKMAEEIFRLYPDVDGIFGSDLAALACLNVAQRKGIRVPEDLSIIGFDAMVPSGMVYPQLTAIRQNVELLAEISVNALLDMVEQRKNVPNRLIWDVEIQQGGDRAGRFIRL